jgi:hypothetical protein
MGPKNVRNMKEIVDNTRANVVILIECIGVLGISALIRIWGEFPGSPKC